MGAITSAVTDALGYVIEWVGFIVSEMVIKDGSLHELWTLMAVGIAISALMLGVKAIKSFIWGA